MDTSIESRQSICADADRAAKRHVDTHVDQPNPHPEGTTAYEWWRAQYSRMIAFYLDHEASA